MMRRIVTGISILFLFVVVITGSSIWYSNQLIDQRQTDLIKAGQKALNTTVLKSIQSGTIYTGGPTEYVFFGKNALDQPMIAFVTPTTTYAELASQGISQRKIIQQAQLSPVGMTQIQYISPGMIDPNMLTEFSKKTSHSLVWELYGKSEKGQMKYAYYD